MTTFVDACRALIRDGVRFVVIGVWGANYYARSVGTTLATRDLDAFLPLDAHNLVLAWKACKSVGCSFHAARLRRSGRRAEPAITRARRAAAEAL
jgi:hypothetical protein